VNIARYIILKIVWYVIAVLFGITLSEACAEQSLITGDPGNQDEGKYQMKFTGNYEHIEIMTRGHEVKIVELASADTATADVSRTAAPTEGKDEGAGLKDGTLTGDWGGQRTALSKKGIDAEIVYKFDVISNTSGGAKTGTDTLDNLDVKFSFDGEKLFGSPGTTALIYFLNNNGGRPGATLVDNAEGVDNIEVQNSGGKLYEAWIQQNFMKDQFSILAGLHDLNSEFYVTETSGLFIRPTFGIGSDMSQSGRNGPSIFPNTSACVRLKVQPSRNYSVQVAAFDGVPGNPDNPRGTHVDFKHGDGALIVGEADYLPGGESPNGKLGVGAWRYTEKFDDFTDTDDLGNPLQRPSNGMYVLAERGIYRVPGHDDQGLKLFVRFGVADGDVNRFDYAWSTGAVYTGLFGRENGRLGIGVEGAHNSRKYRESVGSADASTKAYELTYSDNLTPWFLIQPDVQYIIDPDTNPELRNALVVGTRFTVKF
jgi:porin